MARGSKRSNEKNIIGQRLYWLAVVPAIVGIVIYVSTIYQGIADEELFAESKSATKPDLQKTFPSKSPPPLRDDITLTTQSIEEVEWSDDESFLNSVIRMKRPVLIRNSTVKDWEVMSWDLMKIAKKGILLNASRLQKSSSVFVLGSDRDKGGMIGTINADLEYVHVHLKDFLGSMFDDDTYLYWTGPISKWENEETGLKVASAAGGWEKLKIVEPSINISAADTTIWTPMLWISHPGVVAQTHYDTQHNCFAQVIGKKRFLIFNPQTEMHIYPNIHKSFRQSQLHMEINSTLNANSSVEDMEARRSEFSAKFPSANKLHAIEVILNPGDLLYIPPYWPHRVESLTFSMSVSVISPSDTEAALNEAYWTPVPFGLFESGGTEIKSGAIKVYLALIVASADVFEGQTLDTFAKQLYESRFRPFYFQDESNNRYTNGKFKCPSTSNNHLVELLQKNLEKMKESAIIVTEYLNELNAHDKIKETFFRDYAEQLIRWAVGPEDTVLFIRYCLKM